MQTGHSPKARLAKLIESRADRFDPARFSYIAALVRRSAQKPQTVKQCLEQKALAAIEGYQRRFASAQKQAVDRTADSAQAHPGKTEPCHDFPEDNGNQRPAVLTGKMPASRALAELRDRICMSKRLVDPLRTDASLDDLLRKKEEDLIAAAAGSPYEKNSAPPLSNGEFFALRYFEQTRNTHHAKAVVALAVKNRPDNPGHLNRQMLATRCLCAMQKLSPTYLHRWVGQMETLLWLEDAEVGQEKLPTTNNDDIHENADHA